MSSKMIDNDFNLPDYKYNVCDSLSRKFYGKWKPLNEIFEGLKINYALLRLGKIPPISFYYALVKNVYLLFLRLGNTRINVIF